MIDLSNLSPAPGSTHSRKRLGRGTSSGQGKTAGRGQKGQKSRSGGSPRVGFEGGQMPLSRRLPKRGFKNIFAKNIAIVNVEDLNRFDESNPVDIVALRNAGLVRGQVDGVKILGCGDLNVKVNVIVDAVSASAREKIEKAGGSIEVCGG
ncbi:MAG: 50S ribosomal protein L15 [Proteobacteria bacterium]|nr:50S ribosomal protein L15 [Pseudomonadota bacterium]MBQ9244500.1 50S ribosomal protein L15 [Pseudomonadota bacterium]